ncbi:hypothetical protein Q1695_012719 [Nippostrongylus brasiliensis]|nr:hypothetical protein Q1695_012719 [Nippostrongylus brasiliensis]
MRIATRKLQKKCREIGGPRTKEFQTSHRPCLKMSQVRGRCVICTSMFSSNNISALPCGHTFHFACISKPRTKTSHCLKMSQVRGRCVICTSMFSSNNISALPCGHTFHFACISKWVERSKTCPICRVRTEGRSIVKHLFFDSADDTGFTQAPSDYAAQVEQLSIALEQEKSDHLDTQEQMLKLKASVESLEVKLDREKKCYRDKIPPLLARNRQLEMMLVDQKEIERTLELTRSRLRACEFYKAITTAKDETALDKQLDDARKVQLQLKQELSDERTLVRRLKKKEIDLKNIVNALEKELRDVRSAANISTTPFNPKLRSLALEQSPPKRESLGFNESLQIDENVLKSALRKRPRELPLRSKPSTSSESAPIFLSFSDDENDHVQTEADVSLQFPTKLDTVPSPRVPKTMRERVLAGSKNTHATGLGGSRDARSRALAELELRSASGLTSGIARKPLLKRKIAGDEPKNPRLSQFFARNSKPGDVIDLSD